MWNGKVGKVFKGKGKGGGRGDVVSGKGAMRGRELKKMYCRKGVRNVKGKGNGRGDESQWKGCIERKRIEDIFEKIPVIGDS